MIRIILEPAKNGVIKKIVDDNYGGSNKEWSSVDVYAETSDKFEYISDFFYDVCDDLGLDLGNSFSDSVVFLHKKWGKKYKPTSDEISKRILELEEEIQLLKEWKQKKEI
jgi:hypothetical protein